MKRNPSVASFPCPVTLVVVGNKESFNILTVSWAGVVCTTPPILGISIKHSRYSYKLLVENQQFTVHIPTTQLLIESDLCGVLSGKSINKFQLCKFTETYIDNELDLPRIKECPIAFECICENELNLGTHSLFIGKVVGRHIDDKLISNNKIDHSLINPLLCTHGEYWSSGKVLGKAKSSLYKNLL